MGIDGGTQVTDRAVQMHCFSGAGALALVVVGKRQDDIGLRRLLGAQLLERELGLPCLPRRLDGARPANSVVAVLRLASCPTDELFEQFGGLQRLALAVEDGGEKIECLDVGRRKLGHVAQ